MIFAHLAANSPCCARLSSGAVMPMRSHANSILLEKPTPAMSLSRLPNPAAAIVESANVAPMLISMYSPAMIMMALSMNPKPTKGIACAANMDHRTPLESVPEASGETDESFGDAPSPSRNALSPSRVAAACVRTRDG